MEGSSLWSRDDIAKTLSIVSAANQDIAQDVDTPEMRIYRKGYEAALRAVARHFELQSPVCLCAAVTSGRFTARIVVRNKVGVTSGELERHQRDSSQPSQLRRILIRLDASELRTLCFDLDVDYDNLPGEGKMDKARELVMYLKRHQRLSELIETGYQLRPDLAWGSISTDRIS